ncbi:ABC-type Mn Zn transport system, ATPase component [Levilactobacillus senmaizukei DSM 21775 = NBRC 103853]|uniref:ABC-type Mn Zn transport system, ATPase component n=1 Tax=Levilactobacillus senmaizukei DSM 21775 = NBRC 103853 TaxID=1423803 RepID=A0A0R2DKZ0_9LACO|nr:ABC transporter ATP-binding protein [Levilactobacillus senmaizukei]KRN01303.1 ABC-type Mn Zn transport system, ATPase component [Levilactobacillus senmaizukei DSM 21775 = NBRC 103853]
MTTTPILKLDNLGVTFPNHPVFKDLNLTINHGDFLSIVGKNGVGKTTLMRTILHQLRPTHGQVTYLPDPNHVKIGYVPQFRNIDADYPLTIEDFVGLNLTGWKWPWLSRTERQAVREILKETGLEAIAKRPIGQASGGERQKAYLAQALVEAPNLLILDESTASLDPVTKTDLLDLVQELNQCLDLTVLFVTHDIPMARKYSTEYLMLTPRGAEQGPIAGLTQNKVWEGENV